tara:strand:+ start:25859 stop:26350 length:492 start_codon:yes stop_codon:yes gene_type:complete
LKKLYIVRHAKSSWVNAQLKDFDRPLNDRGLAAASEMGDRLLKAGIFPDVIISSPALQALTTAKLIANRFKNKIDIIEESELYQASTFLLLNIVNRLSDKFDNVFLVGHNPGLTDFAEYLSNEQFGNIQTASLVGIQFDFDSLDLVSSSTGDCFLFDYPKRNA